MKDFDKDDQNQTKDKTITTSPPPHHTKNIQTVKKQQH